MRKGACLECNLCVKGPCSPGGWLNTLLPWEIGNEFLGLVCFALFVEKPLLSLLNCLYSTPGFSALTLPILPSVLGGQGVRGCEGLLGLKPGPGQGPNHK